jgi:hypothetical protein
MPSAQRKIKLAERVQAEGTPHKFKRWVYIYNRHKSRIIVGLLMVIAMLLSGMIYLAWLLYQREPGVLIKAAEFTVFQQMNREDDAPGGYYIITDEETGEATFAPVEQNEMFGLK